MTEVSFTVIMLPASANVLKRKYRTPHAYAEYRNQWARTIHYTLSYNQRTWLEERAKAKQFMFVDILIRHNQLFDKDNLYASVKPILDVLRVWPEKLDDSFRGLGLIAGDSQEEIKLHVHQEKVRAKETRISISEEKL